MHMSSHEADPMGDVILLLENGSVGVRATSRVLSLAFPAFAAMLSSTIKSAQ